MTSYLSKIVSNSFNNSLIITRIIPKHAAIVSVIRHKRKEPKRKPIWAPTAPSKLFQIREKVVYEKDEKEQMDHLYFHYDSEMESILEYCRVNIYEPTKTSSGINKERLRQDEDEFKQLLADNHEENLRVAKLREERLKGDMQSFETDILNEESKRKTEEDQRRQNAEALINLEVQRSKTFITRDKLEKAIEEAILNPVHYDYSVDKEGNVVTDGKLHDNAFKPSAIPESSSSTAIGMKQLSEGQKIKFKTKRLYQKVERV